MTSLLLLLAAVPCVEHHVSLRDASISPSPSCVLYLSHPSPPTPNWEVDYQYQYHLQITPLTPA